MKWYKSPASVSFSITFLSVAMFIYSLLVSEIVSLTSSFVMFSLMENDSGVSSLLNALDVVFFFLFFFFVCFFLGVAVAEMFFFGVTNRGNCLCFG